MEDLWAELETRVNLCRPYLERTAGLTDAWVTRWAELTSDQKRLTRQCQDSWLSLWLDGAVLLIERQDTQQAGKLVRHWPAALLHYAEMEDDHAVGE